MRRLIIAALASVVIVATGAAQPSSVSAWRAAHERQILDELLQLVSIPNVAGNDADMRRNADALEAMFTKRGFKVERSSGPGSPVVFATLDVPAARGTLTLYIHYDGQPVNDAEWTRCKPFAPCVHGADGPVTLGPDTRLDPEWRVYGRSASDDKGPIVAVVNAVEALRAAGAGPLWNLRVVLDGQEEAGSANFRRFAEARAADLKGDIAMTLDGPRHPSGRPTLYYGVRGGAGLTVTVFGAKGDLHSGNYGNWAPDPSMRLAKLLASMKDDAGRVTIAGFYDDVTPLTQTELKALEDMPNVEAVLKKDFLVAQPERPEQRLERKLNEPTLSVLVMESGGGFGAPARSAIPASARARIEMRLVHGLDPAKQNRLVVDHIRKQGYFVVDGRDPSDEERLTHPLIARVDLRGGSTAPRVSLDDPMTKAVFAALSRGGRQIARLPTLGGGMPFATFSERMPTVGLSIVNHDNNQHGANENLRLRNLWEGIEMMADVMTMERP
ncbi:MAG: M20/M25/M40 family metallo-hydrolase [Acidobacteria bacterium]|nr:M20/M25/M40 family metallo-hydrolase [Acidobacteriota bacterium]